MTHTRRRRYHPQAQGKIERYHRSIKNVVKLDGLDRYDRNFKRFWSAERARPWRHC